MYRLPYAFIPNAGRAVKGLKKGWKRIVIISIG
nr:MAG TPA: hypothetical protein [Caudoviricetes sp.]